MNIKDICEVLENYNKWRRYKGDIDKSPEHPNPKVLGDVIDRAVEALNSMPIGNQDTAPKDGSEFLVHHTSIVRWNPYKPQARKQGYPDGRWQKMNEYGRFENFECENFHWSKNNKRAS